MYALRKKFRFLNPEQAKEFASLAAAYGEVKLNGFVVEVKATLTFLFWRQIQTVAKLLKSGRPLDNSDQQVAFKALPLGLRPSSCWPLFYSPKTIKERK